MTDLVVGIESSVDEAIRDFGEIKRKTKTVAMVRAANRAASKVRTESGREVRKVYMVKVSTVKRLAKIIKASVKADRTEAIVRFIGPPLPVTEFGARAVNPYNIPGKRHRRRGGGVSVRIKRSSGRKVIEGAFLTRAKSGKQLVLERIPPGGRVGARQRTSPPNRYPVRAVTTVAIPTMVGSRAVFAALTRFGGDTFDKEFRRQLDLLVKRA